MNFFERQAEVRKVSGRLVFLFAIAVVGIIVVVNLAAYVFFLRTLPESSKWNAILWITVLLLVIIGATSLFRLNSLKHGGGGKVARALGGVYVSEDTTDPQLRRLRNVVEEIAIASGTPVPELYVLPQEQGINAFAAGWSPADAAVAVTRGTLERLNRDELQGVIAHEFSHVVNGDMRLNIRLMGVLFGILALAVVGRILLHGGRGKNGAPIVAMGLVAMIAGGIGLFCGKLIKAAVSRQREYLADASAVQFTRQSDGIAGALKKIGGLHEGSKLASGKADDVSHMLFGEGSKFSSMFATHPPLEKRIQVLQPSFNPAELDHLRQQWSAAPPSGLQEDRALGFAGAASAPPQGAPVPGPPPGAPVRGEPVPGPPPASMHVRPEAVVAGIGDPSASSYEHGESILRRIPEQFKDRARRVDTVVPLVLGLLMADHPEARSKQHAAVAQRHGQQLADAVWQEAAALRSLDPELRLPLSELAFSALRRRPPQELEHLMGTLGALIRADGRVDVFEYCLSTLLHTELHEVMHHKPPWSERRQTLARGGQAVADLLSVLARVGNDDPRQGEAAFRAGLGRVLPGQSLPFAPPQQGLVALDRVWPALDGLAGNEKALLVESLVLVISHDGVMTLAEVELLRTVCALLHCPMPPLSSGTLRANQTPGRP